MRALRSAARRLTLALLVVAVLSGVGMTFPQGAGAAQAWRFLLGQWTDLAHAVLGVAVLIDASVLLARVARPPATRAWALPLLGVASVAVAVGAGIAYVSLRQPGAALGWMTAGWLAAQTVYLVVWVRSHRDLTVKKRSRVRVDPQS